MARRRKAQVRTTTPDAVYGSSVVAKFINKLMYEGKKGKAEDIFYKALTIAQDKSGKAGLEAFTEALANIKPAVEVKSRRVGGSTYQVPVEVREERQNALAFKWLVNAARSRAGKSMTERLANEMVDAINNTGGAVRQKEAIHRMAEGNKAFSHFRW